MNVLHYFWVGRTLNSKWVIKHGKVHFSVKNVGSMEVYELFVMLSTIKELSPHVILTVVKLCQFKYISPYL